MSSDDFMGEVKSEDYLVTTSRGKRSRSIVWNGREPVALDHPARWVLKKSSVGIQAWNIRGDNDPIDFVDHELRDGVHATLANGLVLRVQRLRPVRAAYLPAIVQKGLRRPDQFFIFHGVRYFLVGFQPATDQYKAFVDKKPVFSYYRKELGGYDVTGYREGIRLKFPDGEHKSLVLGTSTFVPEEEFSEITIKWGKNWWRVNRIPTPEALPHEAFELEDNQDKIWFKRIAWATGIAIIGSLIWMQTIKQHFTPPKPEAPPTVALKKPKVLPRPVQAPPKIVAVAPKPKPTPKPPEPKPIPAPPKPQVAKKAEPPKPLPPKKEVAQKKDPTPKKAAERQVVLTPPKTPPKPGPAQGAPAKTKAGPPAAVAQNRPNPSGETAKAQAQLAKSLAFLSPSVNKAAAPNITNDTSGTKYNVGASVVTDSKKPSILSNLAYSGAAQGQIETKSARNVNSSVALSGGSGRGKALNEVQGRVALNALYDTTEGGELGSSLTGGGKGGMTLSGAGQIDESVLQKVLSKYLSKFQYCYEKALLSDASLSGAIVMQWVIHPGGRASDVKVVKSALNNAALHSCLSRELGSINYPSPNGGSVTVKYPFAFSSTSL